MITWNNTSHTPNQQNCLQFINEGNSNLIAWDGKTTGWICFDFQTPLKFIKTKIRGGCGIWQIEYSDNNQNFTAVCQFNISQIKEIQWPQCGPHRYWRYNLITNNGAPYYHGYEWFYID